MFPLKDNIPLARFPIVTVALVAINVFAYLLEIRHGGSFFGGPNESVAVHYGAIPYELTHPGRHCDLVTASTPEGDFSSVACQGMPGVRGTPSAQPATWATAFTSMFLHGSFLHLFGNMLFLAIFGPTIEDALGRLRFAASQGTGQPRHAEVQLGQEPEPQQQHGGDLDDRREEDDEHEADDSRSRIQHQIAAEHRRDRPRGAERRGG